MSKKLDAEIAMQALYDLMQCADTGEHLTQASEATANAWATFFGSAGAGKLGTFSTLSGNTINELGCLQMIASYCDQVLENFLKPLSGLPIVDWGFRYGTRDIIALANLYAQLRINTPDPSQAFTTFSVQGEDLWNLPGENPTELEQNEEGNFIFAFYWNTTDPANYLTKVVIVYEVEGDPEPTTDTFFLSEPEDDEQSWMMSYPVPGLADYIEVSCHNDTGVLRDWTWT